MIGSVVLMLAFTEAGATPVAYSESVSGDLSTTSLAVLSLDIGDNTISGTTHFGLDTAPGVHFDSDFDSFAFIVPTGAQLVGISFSFVTTSNNVAIATAEYRLCPGVGSCGLTPATIGIESIDVLGVAPISAAFGSPLTLDSGTYTLSASGLGIGLVSGPHVGLNLWTTDYTWHLSLISVPEPEMLGIFLTGLIALVLLRRNTIS